MLEANIATTILPLALVKISSNAVDDVDFRAGEAAAVDVRAVGQQRQHAGRAELGEPVDVDVLAIERRLIDLEVAGVDDHAARRLDRDRDAVRHAVRDAQELERERPTCTRSRGRTRRSRAATRLIVLLELRFDERQRQRRAVDRARRSTGSTCATAPM